MSDFHVRATIDRDEGKYLVLADKRTTPSRDPVIVTETQIASIAIFDWDWTFIGRQTLRLTPEQLKETDHLVWHKRCVEALESLRVNDKPIHLRLDHVHISMYLGDFDPNEEMIEHLKNQKPHTTQYHNGKGNASEYLPKDSPL